jgi:hypothetical protein
MLSYNLLVGYLNAYLVLSLDIVLLLFCVTGDVLFVWTLFCYNVVSLVMYCLSRFVLLLYCFTGDVLSIWTLFCCNAVSLAMHCLSGFCFVVMSFHW